METIARSKHKSTKLNRDFPDDHEYALITTPFTITIESFISGEHRVLLNNPLQLPVLTTEWKSFSVEYKPYNLIVYTEKLELLHNEICLFLDLLWRKIAKGNEGNLTEGARKLRQNLLATMREI